MYEAKTKSEETNDNFRKALGPQQSEVAIGTYTCFILASPPSSSPHMALEAHAWRGNLCSVSLTAFQLDLANETARALVEETQSSAQVLTR